MREGKVHLAASDEVHHLYPIFVLDLSSAPILSPHDIAIEFYSDTLLWQRKKIEQLVKLDVAVDLSFFPVEVDRDHC
jgi:hypothetical protein